MLLLCCYGKRLCLPKAKLEQRLFSGLEIPFLHSEDACLIPVALVNVHQDGLDFLLFSSCFT